VSRARRQTNKSRTGEQGPESRPDLLLKNYCPAGVSAEGHKRRWDTVEFASGQSWMKKLNAPNMVVLIR